MRRRFLILILGITFLVSGVAACGQKKPADYAAARQELVDENTYQTTVKLTDQEKAADEKLSELKARYYADCDGKVPYNMPVLTDETIQNSDLYAFCKDLPKGSDLHIHGYAILPVEELIDFVSGRTDLYLVTEGEKKYTLVYHENASEAEKGEMLLADALAEGVVTAEELKENWTVLGGADEEDIWVWFEKLFTRHTALSASPDLIKSYYEKAFRYCCENNIRHLEVRSLLFGSHEEAVAHAEAIRDAYHAVRSDYPTFVVSLVGSGLKNASFDPALTETLLDNAVYVHETVRDTYDPSDPHDFLTGIDLVNEEDKSRSLEEFAPMLLNIRKEHPDLHILLHAGESLYADSDNVIDAYLIGAERIGHGLNTYRYPDLLEDMIKDQVCLEVCPISNQTLRYVEDLRTHPATEYLKRGLPIALCSDDPAYQEHTTLADDFFAAIVCWDLGIPEIKQLCRNSIQYSSVDEALKKEMLSNWEKDWETFISQVSSF